MPDVDKVTSINAAEGGTSTIKSTALDKGNSTPIKMVGKGDLTEEEEAALEKALLFISDVPLKLIAELGRLELKIRDLLTLTQGTVLELNKLAGEPLEILINDRLICRGEVIVSGEKYGIRMTDIIDPTEGLVTEKE